jgi:hypothetical protein
MKTLITVVLLFIMSTTAAAQRAEIELTRDNPDTLISTNSAQYRVFGFRLGMSHPEAERNLARQKLLLGENDSLNPGRIYVYDRTPDGQKSKSVLYLIWKPGEAALSEITVFTDCARYLTPNFARLLTPEGVSETSAFRKKFIGAADRSDISLEVKSIDLKNTSYHYERIGVEVTLVHSDKKENVVFALVAQKNPNP